MSLEFHPPVDANASLSYVVYDEYILNNNGEHGSAHVDDSISLHDYKKINKMEVEYDKDAREDGIRVFPGETEHVAAYQIVTDQCKKIAHTLLKGLRINELRFMCFSQFDESNVFVSPSGKVKFKNVHVISNLTPEELLEQQKQNYESAALVIEGLFVQNPPPDFEDLIKLIRTDFGARELYHIHAACVPMALFSAAFKDTYDHIRFALPKEDLRNILVTLPYVDTWKNELSTNDLLMVTFDYNPKSYQVPPSSDTQTCLNKFQKLAMKDLGLTPKAKQKKLEENEIQLIEALHFFDYLRNRTSHRMEPFQKLLQNDHPYTAEGSELVTYIRFPRILAYLQLELYRRKQHKNVPMDKYV